MAISTKNKHTLAEMQALLEATPGKCIIDMHRDDTTIRITHIAQVTYPNGKTDFVAMIDGTHAYYSVNTVYVHDGKLHLSRDSRGVVMNGYGSIEDQLESLNAAGGWKVSLV